MPEPRQLVFSNSELAEILVRHQGIRKGHWGISVRFGLSATTIEIEFQGARQPVPVAIVPVLEIGIREFDEPSSSTVDASKVQKRPAKKKAKKKKAAKKRAASKRKPKG